MAIYLYTELKYTGSPEKVSMYMYMYEELVPMQYYMHTHTRTHTHLPQAIHDKILSLDLQQVHAKIKQVDSHATLGNGIVIQVGIAIIS